MKGGERDFQGNQFSEKVGCALEAAEPPKENWAPSPVQTRTEGKVWGVPLPCFSQNFPRGLIPQPQLPSVLSLLSVASDDPVCLKKTQLNEVIVAV